MTSARSCASRWKTKRKRSPFIASCSNALKDAPSFWRSTPDKWSMPRSFTQAKSTRCSASPAKSSLTILFGNLPESLKQHPVGLARSISARNSRFGFGAAARTPRSSIMPDTHPTRTPQTESSPRHQASPADPCAMVLFGATGDLTKRLVMPALYNLSRTKVLPEKFALIGVARAEGTAESWRDHLHDTLKSFVGSPATGFDIEHIDEAAWKRLAKSMLYIQGDATKPELHEKLRGVLDEAKKAYGTQDNAIFYLAIADRLFGTVVGQLGKAKLAEQDEDQNGKPRFWRRVVIEKPFGDSLESARKLNARIRRTLHEDQIFRIDHFLGKDTVQSIMAFRFANGLFEPIWNRDRIDHVQITAAETVGVEQRGKFYEKTGALRDMVPNHLFQLLAMTAMEPPISFDANAVRAKKAEVIQAIHPLDPAAALKNAVRGQYDAGTVLGKPVQAYRH